MLEIEWASVTECSRRIGVSKPVLYTLLKDPEFPRQIIQGKPHLDILQTHWHLWIRADRITGRFPKGLKKPTQPRFGDAHEPSTENS